MGVLSSTLLPLKAKINSINCNIDILYQLKEKLVVQDKTIMTWMVCNNKDQISNFVESDS